MRCETVRGGVKVGNSAGTSRPQFPYGPGELDQGKHCFHTDRVAGMDSSGYLVLKKATFDPRPADGALHEAALIERGIPRCGTRRLPTEAQNRHTNDE